MHVQLTIKVLIYLFIQYLFSCVADHMMENTCRLVICRYVWGIGVSGLQQLSALSLVSPLSTPGGFPHESLELATRPRGGHTEP